MRSYQRSPWIVLSLAAIVALPGCGAMGGSGVKASAATSFGILSQQPYQRLEPVPVHPQRFPARIIAHRGFSSRFPENTLSSFRAAVQAGADMVELDVQLTKDGEMVVMHDDSVDRTTNGKGKIKNLSFQEIRSLDAGSKFNPQFVGERVPTLEEAVDAVYGGAMLNIEVKNIDQASQRPVVAQKIKELLDRKNFAEHVQIMSFDADFMQVMRQQAPTISMSLLSFIDPLNTKLHQAQKLKLDGLNLHYKAASKDEVGDLHRAGLMTHVFTLNQPDSMEKVLQHGVDGIITNQPDLAGTVMDAYYHSRPAPTAPMLADEDVD